jgi:hypothetical protein
MKKKKVVNAVKDAMMSFLQSQLLELKVEKEILEHDLKMIQMERELIDKKKEDYDYQGIGKPLL